MRSTSFGTAFVALTGVALLLLPTGSLLSGHAGHVVGTGAALSSGGTPVVSPDVQVAIAPAYAAPSGVRDLGPLPGSVPMTVDVALASRDPRGLAALANASSGPTAGPGALAPGAAASRFGAAPSAVRAATSYFAAFGLEVRSHPDGLLLAVSGPSGAIARAFGTSFERYQDPSGRTFVDHPTPAHLPAVAPWSGAYGLGSSTPVRPELRPAPNPAAAHAAAGCASMPAGLAPCQVAAAYDFAGLLGSGQDGRGKRVAVIDAYASAENQSRLSTDLLLFASAAALPAPNVTFLYPVPTSKDLNASGVNTAWSYEDALDLEWAFATAPGAEIQMVFSPDPGAGLYFAIDRLVADGLTDVLSMSWGEPEIGIYNAEAGPCDYVCNASTDGSFAILGPVLQLAAVEGISAFAASGDCGAADGTSGATVNFPASYPYVTGVGGTNLALAANGSYGSETAWSGNTSGAHAPGCQNQGGSGGGFSIFPRPGWQTGNGSYTTPDRGVPDVAMVGGTAVSIVYHGGAAGVLGTSVGTPIWAGLAAIADQVAGTDLGLLNPSLYHLLVSPRYATDFHDITSGSNGYPAGPGWDPVTGVGTPDVAHLVADLTRGAIGPSHLSTFVYASPRFGPAPLTVKFTVATRGASGSYPVQGIAYGDGNSSAAPSGSTEHTYAQPGVYSVQSYAVSATDNSTTSPPVVVVVGGGHGLDVTLSVSTTSPAVGSPVTFTASASGGTGPYLYNLTFGDGSFAVNLSSGTATHAYVAAGGYCAEAIARDAASPIDGAASLRVAVAAGGAAAPSCGDPASPITLSPNASATVRDAPADFPSLFNLTGGSTAPGGLEPQIDLEATGDPYPAACGCLIFRSVGTYPVREWANDTVNGEAFAETNVTVAPPLVGTFTASPLFGTVPLTVHFTASVSGGYGASAGATVWTFGNGQSSTGSAVQATYTTPGEYVAVAALSDLGYGNASEAFVIDARASGSTAVGATGTVTPAVHVPSGSTVAWTATVVGPPSAVAGTVLDWDLGNGGTAFGGFVNESYFHGIDLLPANTLDASLTVEDAALHPLLRVPITLPGFFAAEAWGFFPAVYALTLSETVYPATGVTPLSITGLASAQGPGGTAVFWLFGDGTSGSGTNVSHIYYGAGDFTVEAHAYDGYDDRAVRADEVAANAALALLGCGPSTRTGAAPYSLTLTADPSGGAGPPYTYRWALPNGNTSTRTNVTLSFPSAGTYDIFLAVRDSANASIGCSWSIEVYQEPAITFLDVVVVGVAAGVGLAVFFVWVTRPRRP